MSDDDLIRRGDVLRAADEELRRYGFTAPEGRRFDMRDRLAALPARGVGVPTEAQFMDAVWAALKADATDLGKQQRILAAFRAALEPAPTDAAQARAPFFFDRYVNGVLMAEGVCIERETTLEGAMQAAARIAAKGPNGEAPVLVYRARAALTTEADNDRQA